MQTQLLNCFTWIHAVIRDTDGRYLFGMRHKEGGLVFNLSIL